MYSSMVSEHGVCVCEFGIMCTSARASGQCSVNGGHLVTVTDFDAFAGHCPLVVCVQQS